MKPQLLILLLLILAPAAGFDRGLPENVQVVPAQQLWVQDSEGNELSIPADQLTNQDPEKPTAEKIFVVDRSTEEECWVAVSEFLENQPSMPRYIPVDPASLGKD